MRLIGVLVVLLLAAGCLTPESADVPPAEPAAQGGVQIDAERPDTAFTNVETGPAAEADETATLKAPPRLVTGEWWRLRFDTPLAGEVAEVVRVVAAVEGAGYLIGMPHEGWFKEAIAYHSPAFGDVGLDLSYLTHNVRFEPVRFPLVEGATWETEFATSPLVATVESIEDTKATVVFRAPEGEPTPEETLFSALGVTPGEEALRIVYDASLHEVAEFTSVVGTYRIVEHGYDYEGWVTIPRGHDTAIDYGQFGPATPGEPIIAREIDVAGGFNRMTLMHAVFPLAPGAYRVRTVAPDGTEYLTESTGGEMVLRFFEARDPDGTWTAEDVVAGAGVTYSMGIAYHQYDIRLPDGLRRADHSHEVIR